MFGGCGVAGGGAPVSAEGIPPRSRKRNPCVTRSHPWAGNQQGSAARPQGETLDTAAILGLAASVAADQRRQGMGRLELLLAMAGCPEAGVEARRLVAAMAEGVAL